LAHHFLEATAQVGYQFQLYMVPLGGPFMKKWHFFAQMLPLAALVLLSGCPNEVPNPPKGDCTDNTDCEVGKVCQEGACVEACGSDADCGNGHCQLTSGRCVQCLENGHCASGETCNTLTGQCTAGSSGCTNNSECPSGVCDTGKGACVQCTDNSHCPGGFCNLADNSCQTGPECTVDGDCFGGRCEPTGQTCVECYDNSHCSSGNCNTTSNVCIPGCNDTDSTEPNDTTAQAAPLTDGSIHQGSICQSDIDMFSIEASGDVSVSLAFNTGIGTLRLKLLDSTQGTVATGANDPAGAALSATGLAAGTYYIEVSGGGEQPNDYSLSVSAGAAAGCTQLDNEPNDSAATGSPLTTDGTLSSGSICGSDVDYFTFSVATATNIDLRVYPGEGAGNLSVALLNPSQQQVGTGTQINYAAPAAGTFTVRVQAAGGDRSYSLRVLVSDTAPPCTQTDAEPNDDPDDARPISPGAAASAGSICANDLDQYRFSAQELDDVVVTLTTTGDVTAQLIRESDGQNLGAGQNITSADLSQGTYRVVVLGNTPQSEGTYTVAVALTPEPQVDECMEANPDNDTASAQPISLDGAPLAGRICVDDQDHYKFDVGIASTLVVNVEFTHADGDLDIRLLDAAGAVVTSSLSVTDNETIIRDVEPGRYYIRVEGWQSAENTYTVSASLQGCSPDDDFEDNGSVETAAPVGPQTFNAVRCPGDDDYFSIRVLDGDSVSVSLTPTGGALSASLVNSAGDEIATDMAGAGLQRNLSASVLPAGTYALRVTGTEPSRIEYTVTLGLTNTTPRTCYDDGAEPNQSTEAGFLVDDTGFADGAMDVGALVLCSGNDDYYQVDLPQGKIVTLSTDFDSGSSNIDLSLLEDRGGSTFSDRTLASAEATNKEDSITGYINRAGRYYVKATHVAGNAQLPYRLRIEVADPPATSCQDDRFDTLTVTTDGNTETVQNNTGDTAVRLHWDEVVENQQICDGDEDWFTWYGIAGDTVQVNLNFIDADGDLDMWVYGPNDPSVEIGESNGTSDNEEITGLSITENGYYFIKVDGFLSAENSYQLVLETEF
jgi:Cys-rich repeat protein